MGDSIDDMRCGRAAGLATCLIASPDAELASPPWPDEIDFAITALAQLEAMLEDATDPAACNSPNEGRIACVRRTGSARGDGRMAPTLEETKTRPIRTTSVCQIGVLYYRKHLP